MLWYEIFFHYLRIKNEPTSFLHARHVFVRNGANKISRKGGGERGRGRGREKEREEKNRRGKREDLKRRKWSREE